MRGALEEPLLVEGLRARQEEAVRAYLERYRSLFLHCIAQFEADLTRRDELLQDLAWHALERLRADSFDAERGSFGTWLYRVAWCRCVDLKRRQNAKRRVHLTTGVDDLSDRPDTGPEPVEALGSSEIGERVRAALLELDDEARALIELRHSDGLTLQEVGERLGFSLEQTKYRLKRASSQLRRALLAHLPQEEVLE
jgi:RNA polymerase sigma-70 factor, ECF subfamily